MFGIKHEVELRQLRKQLLIAESEVNRSRLRQEGRKVADEFGRLADRARSVKAVATSVLPVLGGLRALFRRNPACPPVKTSWLHKTLAGVRIASALWLLFRSRGSEAPKGPPAPATDNSPA